MTLYNIIIINNNHSNVQEEKKCESSTFLLKGEWQLRVICATYLHYNQNFLSKCSSKPEFNVNLCSNSVLEHNRLASM